MIKPLTEREADALHTLLHDEITEFGYTQDVTPHDYVALEISAVERVHAKVLKFEEERR